MKPFFSPNLHRCLAVGLLAQPLVCAAVTGPQPAVDAHFDIMDYAVVGNSVLSEDDIGRTLDPYLGEGKTKADIDAAVKALNDAYEQRGYKTVAVSADSIISVDGVVRLKVQEQTVGRLRVAGTEYSTISEIKQEAPSVAQGTVPNFNAISTDIKHLNLPYRTVTPAISPGRDDGTVDVELKVQDQLPIEASLEVNNHYSTNTKPYRLQASLGYDNLFQLGHAISMTYTVAPQNMDQTDLFSGTYTVPIGNGTFSAALTGLTSNSNVAAAGNTDVLGKGYQIGTRLNWNPDTPADFTSTVYVELDWKDFDQNITTNGNPLPSPVHWIPLTVGYQGTVTEAHAVDSAALSLEQNLAIGSSSPTAFDNKAAGATPNFTIFRADLARDQDIDWGIKLHAGVGAQGTDHPIINNESFALGGYESVRGYLEAETIADSGIHGTLELRSPDVAQFLFTGSSDERILNDLSFLMFFDGGTAWVNQPGPGQRGSYRLYSTGLGTRTHFAKYFNASLDVAWALANGVETRSGDMRTLFKLGTSFP